MIQSKILINSKNSERVLTDSIHTEAQIISNFKFTIITRVNSWLVYGI